jgi:hypothetical protein
VGPYIPEANPSEKTLFTSNLEPQIRFVESINKDGKPRIAGLFLNPKPLTPNTTP